jgi:hypothetical protein
MPAGKKTMPPVARAESRAFCSAAVSSVRPSPAAPNRRTSKTVSFFGAGSADA